jgi:hypothetical protein
MGKDPFRLLSLDRRDKGYLMVVYEPHKRPMIVMWSLERLNVAKVGLGDHGKWTEVELTPDERGALLDAHVGRSRRKAKSLLEGIFDRALQLYPKLAQEREV